MNFHVLARLLVMLPHVEEIQTLEKHEAGTPATDVMTPPADPSSIKLPGSPLFEITQASKSSL